MPIITATDLEFSVAAAIRRVEDAIMIIKCVSKSRTGSITSILSLSY